MLKKSSLILIMFSITMASSASAAVVKFSPISPNPNAFFDLPYLYDYSPSAMNEGGKMKTWYCGGYESENITGDAIYYSAIHPSGLVDPSPTAVLTARGSSNYSAEDSMHACAPTVLKRSYQFINGGQELYLMYYECARRLFSRPNLTPLDDGFPQICLAVSSDGINWQKYNENLWNTSGVFGDFSTDPTPVVRVPQQILNNLQYQFTQNLHTVNLNGQPYDYSLNYGVGHPSAIQINNEVWLYYWNSGGAIGQMGLYLVKSWDGLHFDSPRLTNAPGNANVVYYPGVVGDRTGVFIAVHNATTNAFSYSFDGMTWQWGVNNNDIFTNYNIGKVNSNKCVVPGLGTFVTDKLGIIENFSAVTFLSGEGYLGTFDNGTQLNCYSSLEDYNEGNPNTGRGSTWAIYGLGGAFIASVADTTPPSVPVNLSASVISSSQINLSWSASTDNIGVAGYNVYRNGMQIATTPSTAYLNSGLSPSTNYTFSIAAYDAAGNVSGQSSSISATTQTVSTPIVGDINLDHIVNSIDYSILNSRWFTTDAAADLNDDGIVNGIDYSILNSNWFKSW